MDEATEVNTYRYDSNPIFDLRILPEFEAGEIVFIAKAGTIGDKKRIKKRVISWVDITLNICYSNMNLLYRYFTVKHIDHVNSVFLLPWL
jgi:hypothetical protein